MFEKLKKIPRLYLVGAALGIIVGVFIYTTIRKHDEFYTSGQYQEKPGSTFGKTHFSGSFKRFAGAETLRRTKSTELLAEAEKVLDQNGLPGDIFTDDVPQVTNIAATLYEKFHQYYEIVDDKSPNDPGVPPNDMRKLWGASPVGAWDIDKTKIDSVKEVINKMEAKRSAIRSMLEQRETCFYFMFSREEGSWHTQVDTDASKYLADYALLEEYAIADALQRGEIENAFAALAYTFRIAQLAAVLPAAGVRADAAAVRLRAFDVMQRVMTDPKLEAKHLLLFRNMLTEQYAGWSPEDRLWFGDRAAGIKYYNGILVQGPGAVIDPADIDELRARNVYVSFLKGFLKSYPADEVFYLRSMQNIIDISKKPYCERKNVLENIRKALAANYDTNQEPYVAQLQLKDVDNLMRLFAHDQLALNRALALMLVSLGQKDVSSYLDPFTGKPVEIKKVDGLLTNASVNLPRPFRVPDFRGK